MAGVLAKGASGTTDASIHQSLPTDVQEKQTRRLGRHWKMKTEKAVTRKMKMMTADMQTKAR